MRDVGNTKLWMNLAGVFVILALIIVFAISSYFPPNAPDTTAITDEQRPAIEDIVREYLLQNPEIIRDSLIELDRRDQLAQADIQQQAITQYSDLIFSSDTDFVVGNPNGDVTLVEYFDYNCGFCRRAVADLDRLLQEDPNLRVVLKEFPVLGQESIEAARVAIASIGQGKYMAFHKALFDAPGAVNGARALEIAEQLGMDPVQLAASANQPAKNQIISTTVQIATALGINGTPSYIIGNQLVVGAVGYDALKAAIDTERERVNAGS